MGRILGGEEIIYYPLMKKFPKQILFAFAEKIFFTESEFFHTLLNNIANERYIKNASLREYCLAWARDNEEDIKALWKYGYRLFLSDDIGEVKFSTIYEFLKSGVLASKR